MSSGWQKLVQGTLKSLRDLVLAVSIVTAIQFVLSLLLWLVLFSKLSLGFPMALTLAGFVGWFLSFLSTFAGGRRRTATMSTAANLFNPFVVPQFATRRETPAERAERFGCGTVLFAASLIPLGVAFFLRKQADISKGMTWSDIFYYPK